MSAPVHRRPRGVNRKPQLTAAARAGLAHVVALMGETWPVPLQHAPDIMAAREWITRTLAHHESPRAVALRVANVESTRAARQKSQTNCQLA